MAQLFSFGGITPGPAKNKITMKTPLLVTLTLIGSQAVGCSQESKQEQPKPTQAVEKFAIPDIKPAIAGWGGGRVFIVGQNANSEQLLKDGAGAGYRSIPWYLFPGRYVANDQGKISDVPIVVRKGEPEGVVFAVQNMESMPLSTDTSMSETRGISERAISLLDYSTKASFSGAKEVRVEARNGGAPRSDVWGDGAVHFLVGRVNLSGRTFVGDSAYPLCFKLTEEKGYAYLCGRGTVSLPDGGSQRLGYGHTVELWLPRLKAADESERDMAATAVGWLAKSEKEVGKALPPLLDALKDSSRRVRASAAEALGRLGSRKALDGLKSFKSKESDESLQQVADEAIKRIEK